MIPSVTGLNGVQPRPIPTHPAQHLPVRFAALTPYSNTDVFQRTQEQEKTSFQDLYAETVLSDSERTLVDTLDRLSQQTHIKTGTDIASVLSEPLYRTVTRNDKRPKFFTPLVETYLNLSSQTQRKKLINLLHRSLKNPTRQTMMENALDTLVDIYFFAARPGGKAYQHTQGNLVEKIQADALQVHLLGIFAKIVNNKGYPAHAGRILQQRLRNELREIVKQPRWVLGTQDPTVIADLRKQIMPFIAIYHPLTDPRPAVPESQREMLQRALMSDDDGELRSLSLSGHLSEIMPEWSRLIGPENTQHKFHDFTLDEHTLRVVERTKRSKYFGQLSAKEQQLVTIAALIHDIGKHTGPENLREHLRPDRQHPYKSSDVARKILPSLGYEARDIERVARLIEWHQLFGTMIITHPGQTRPAKDTLNIAALRIKTRSMLRMLMALSEGDIRGVKDNDALFDAEVEYKLHWYGKLVETQLLAQQKHAVFLPQSNVDDLLHTTFDERSGQSQAGFIKATSLVDLLKRMKGEDIRAGLSLEGQVPVLKIQKAQVQHWLTVPFNGQPIPGDMHWGDHDDPLYIFHYRRSAAKLDPEDTVGLIADVLPENTLLSHRLPLRADLNHLNGLDNTYLKIVTQQLDDPALAQLYEKREEQADFYAHTAQYHGTGDWFDAYESLWEYDFNERMPIGLDSMAEYLTNHHLGSPGIPNETLGIRPLIKGMYVFQNRPGEAVKLSKAARDFLIQRRLPLIIVEDH